MDVFKLHIESVGSYRERQYKLTLKQGEYVLAAKTVSIGLDDLLFNEIVGMRGLAKLRREHRDLREALKVCGNYLFDNFLSKGIYQKLSKSKKAFVLVIHDQTDPKLSQIPWEIASFGDIPLIAGNIVFAASRTELTPIPLVVEQRLKVLVFGSLPDDMPPFALERAIRHLTEIFDNFKLKVDLKLDVSMYGGTKDHLAYLIDRAKGYHIIHFLGYAGRSKLILEDHSGSSTPFYSEEFLEMLERSAQKPLLLFLDTRMPGAPSPIAACQALKGGRNTQFRLTDHIGFSKEILQAGQAVSVVSMRQQVTDPFAEEFISEFYYRFLQHNLSLAESFHCAQMTGLKHFASEWFIPALTAGESANQALRIESEAEKLGHRIQIRFSDQEHPRVSEPSDFIGRRRELSLIAKEFIYGNKNLLVLNGAPGVGKRALSARIYNLWKNEFEGVFIHHFSSSRWLIDFWDSLVDFCFRNHVAVDLSESRHPLRRYRDLIKQLVRLLKNERFLFILDNAGVFSEEPISPDNRLNPEKRRSSSYLPALLKSLAGETAVKLVLTDQDPKDFEGCPDVLVLDLGGLQESEVDTRAAGAPDSAAAERSPEKGGKFTFCQAIGGLPFLLKILVNLPENIDSKEIIDKLRKINSFKNEYVREKDYHCALVRTALKSLYPKFSPDLKKLSSILSPYSRELPLYLVLKVFDVSECREIEGFYELAAMGLLEISSLDHPTLDPTVCLHDAYRFFLTSNRADTIALFSQEVELYLRKFGLGFAELAEWLKLNSVRKNILDTYLNSWEYLLAGGDLDQAVKIIEPVKSLMQKNGFIPELEEMLIEALENDPRTENQITYIRTIAELYLKEELYLEAQAKYQESLELSRRQSNKPFMAADLLQLGIIRIKNKLFAEAQKPLKESLALYRELEEESQVAKVLAALGESYRGINDLQTALDLISEAAQINQEKDLADSYVTNIYQLSDILTSLEQYSDALDLLQQALIIEQKRKDKPGICEILRKQARIEHKKGNLPEALDLLNRVLSHETLLKRQKGVARTLLELGEIKREQEATADSRKLIEQGLEISRRLEWDGGLAEGFYQIGLNYNLDGDYNEAIMNLERSLKLYRKLDSQTEICTVSLKLADIHQNLSDYSRALEYCRDALEIRVKRGEVAEVAEIVFKCADIFYLKKSYQQATEEYEKCLEAFRHQNNLSRVADTYHQLATVQQELGHSNEALNFYRKCLQTHEQLGNRDGVALSLAQMGRIMEKDEKLCKAIGKYASALAILQHVESRYTQLAAEDLANLKRQMPEVEFKWCVTAGLEEHAQYLKDIEIKGRDY